MSEIQHKDDYVLGRGVTEAVRLNAQHLLWRMKTGYVIDNIIPIVDGMKIAELGTGTGTWLFDASRNLPSTVELYGYDIGEDQFPAKELWPHNVKFGVLNSLIDSPPELLGRLDVVHIRMWASNLKGNDTSALLQHVKKLLKHDGWVQWEDADLIHQEIKGHNAEKFAGMMRELFKLAGLQYEWVSELPTGLMFQGFEIKRASNTRFQHDLKQLCTSTYLLAIGEILQGIKRNSDGQHPLSIEEHQKALYRLLAESRDSLVYNWRPITVLGRKTEHLKFRSVL